jgi:hypothetical protein
LLKLRKTTNFLRICSSHGFEAADKFKMSDLDISEEEMDKLYKVRWMDSSLHKLRLSAAGLQLYLVQPIAKLSSFLHCKSPGNYELFAHHT